MREHVVEIGREADGIENIVSIGPQLTRVKVKDPDGASWFEWECPEKDEIVVYLDIIESIFGCKLSLSPGQKRRYRVSREGHKRIVFEEVTE